MRAPDPLVPGARESRRMGTLKPLLRIDGITFLERIADELTKAGVNGINIIVGYQAEKIERESSVDAQYIKNEDYKAG